jgi:transcriptional regulator with XRE-family HTH domain
MFSDIARWNVMKEDITGAQVRAGRALVDWSRDDLAERCGCTVRTLARIEAGETVPRAGTSASIRAALEAAGIEFIPENGGGAGVRLRDKSLRREV